VIDMQISDADIDCFISEYNIREDDSERHLSFDEVRRDILKSWKDVQACPGSGKTTLVAVKLLILAGKLKANDGGVCVLTHTNVASNEIKKRLEMHPLGEKAASYPNFIGTIQEFINKFLAIPYIRSLGLTISRIDDEACFTLMNSMISHKTRSFLEIKKASLGALKIDHITGVEQIPGFTSTSNSHSYKDLVNTLHKRIELGYFFYSEMYHFAKQCITKNHDLSEALCIRFPIVMLDEMQDTQEYQDDILNEIFLSGDTCIQRFGDPDQAIYDNIGGEKPNVNFNENTDLTPINSTHRFSSDISSKIHGLSLTQIGELASFRPVPKSNIPHTFFLFTDETKISVLENFCSLLELVDPHRKMNCVKAIGATEGNGGFISEYWPAYDKNQSTINPRPRTLIEAVRRKWWINQRNAAGQYELLISCILEALRIGNLLHSVEGLPRHYTKKSLMLKLKSEGIYRKFRMMITNWLTQTQLNKEIWEIQIDEFVNLFGITECSAKLEEYLSYANVESSEQGLSINNIDNLYQSSTGREVKVGTIHSVKGESHDATLVLETKNHQFDIKTLANNISLNETSKIKTKRKSKFARLLYVAASRPKTLLCFAAHQNHINSDQREALKANGWKIKLL
jgi:superfamily I DNA/RNA helicase